MIIVLFSIKFLLVLLTDFKKLLNFDKITYWVFKKLVLLAVEGFTNWLFFFFYFSRVLKKSVCHKESHQGKIEKSAKVGQPLNFCFKKTETFGLGLTWLSLFTINIFWPNFFTTIFLQQFLIEKIYFTKRSTNCNQRTQRAPQKAPN